MVTSLANNKLMKKTAGVFKDSIIKDDNFWKDVLRKKSRKENNIKHFSRINNLKILS